MHGREGPEPGGVRRRRANRALPRGRRGQGILCGRAQESDRAGGQDIRGVGRTAFLSRVFRSGLGVFRLGCLECMYYSITYVLPSTKGKTRKIKTKHCRRCSSSESSSVYDKMPGIRKAREVVLQAYQIFIRLVQP